jgi:predicted histone-like DNA-binding protein
MNISVVSHAMKHFYNGSLTEYYHLRQEAGTSRVLMLEELADQIQETSSLSKGDVTHTMDILMTEIRKVLVRGDRVKIPGLGIFYMTLSCEGVEKEEELSVRNITKVNIRFLPDKALKLMNSALSPTRSDNNVSFSIKGAAGDSSASGGGGNSTTPATPEAPDTPTTPAAPGDAGDSYVDPEA